MNRRPKLAAAERQEEKWGWIMVAPTMIGLIVLNIWPFIQTIYTSFCEHLGFGHYQFIGLDNYIEMFANPEFWKATWNTVVFCILTVPGGMVLALFVAMLLNANVKFKGGFRTIFFLPLVCAPAAIAMVWQWIFNGQYGILNQILGTNIQWITNSKTAIWPWPSSRCGAAWATTRCCCWRACRTFPARCTRRAASTAQARSGSSSQSPCR